MERSLNSALIILRSHHDAALNRNSIMRMICWWQVCSRQTIVLMRQFNAASAESIAMFGFHQDASLLVDEAHCHLFPHGQNGK